MAIPLTLKVFKGDQLVATKDYERDIIKIGRLASAHLCLDDDKVSRIHSVIDASDGKLSITDMGSMEGTYVNGKRVNKSPLGFGDEVRVGNTRIVVEQRAGASVPAGRAPEVTDQLAVYGNGAPAAAAALASQPVTAPAEVPVAAPPPPANVVVNQVAAPEPVVMTPATARPPSAAAPVAAPVAARPASQGAPVAARPVKPARPRSEASGNVGLQVRFVWGDQILAVHQFDKPTDFVIGSTPKCGFALGEEKLGAPEFAICKGGGSDFVVRVPSRAIGELDDGSGPVQLKESRRLSSDDGGKSVSLGTNDFLWADLGGVRAEFSFAPVPKKVFVPLAERLDYRFMNLLLLILFVAGAFVISAKNFTPDDSALDDDLLKRPAVVAKFLLKEEQKKKNPLLDKLNAEKKKDAEAAAKHSGDEGQMGLKNQKVVKNNRSGVKAIDPNAKDRAKAMVTSLFGGKNGGIQTIFGNGGLGGDLKSAVGNMFGNQVGNSGGLGGLGLKGTGMGGGGMGNTVGIGAIGTHGRGGGMGAYGNGVGGLGGKKDVDIGISNDNAVVMGSLDKELIRQVIHRNRQQIRYCYETQLTRFPKLEGKVAIAFVIGAEGTVQMARVAQSTVNNSELENCLAQRFKSWLFPKPKGGGIVQVTYPVVLKQSGE